MPVPTLSPYETDLERIVAAIRHLSRVGTIQLEGETIPFIKFYPATGATRTGMIYQSGDNLNIAAADVAIWIQLDLVTGIANFLAPIITAPVIVSSLPTAAPANTGARSFVTDATVTTFASIVAGTGGNKVPVYSDGTNWRIG